MGKSMFTIKGNLCSERVRLGRALQKPPITQEELAKKASVYGDGGYDSIDNLPDREKPAACLRRGTPHDCHSAGGFYGMAGGRQ